MRNVKLCLLALLVMPLLAWTQTVDDLDYISPFHDGVAAVQKNGQWAFIDQNGDIVIDFRTDVVMTNTEYGKYPIFSDKRCLIMNKKNGISYYGYIDQSGDTVIKPEFLNATNYEGGQAIVLEVLKETTGQSEMLGKSVVYYKYFEVIIDSNGENKNYLNPDGVNVVLDKDFLREPPKITSKRITPQLVAIKGENGKWTVKKVN